MGPGKQAIEIYDCGRYFAVTGLSNGVSVLTDHQRDIEQLLALLKESHARPPAREVPTGQEKRVYVDSRRYGGGERHNAMVRIAGIWWAQELSAEAIADKLWEFDRDHNNPPKNDPQEIAGIVRWIETRER
jgi:hypothetical protein